MATLQRSEKKQRLVRIIVKEKCHAQEAFFAFRCGRFFLHKTIGDMRAHTHTHTQDVLLTIFQLSTV